MCAGLNRSADKGVYKRVISFQELPNNGVMLVYVSGDGCPGSAKAGEEGTLCRTTISVVVFTLY